MTLKKIIIITMVVPESLFVKGRHDFENFKEDVINLPHWWYKKNNWEEYNLDKDYYGSNQYSPDTCVWLSKEENHFYTRTATPLSVKQ